MTQEEKLLKQLESEEVNTLTDEDRLLSQLENEVSRAPVKAPLEIPGSGDDDEDRLLSQLEAEEKPGFLERAKSGPVKGAKNIHSRLKALQSHLAGEEPELYEPERTELSWSPGDIAEFAGRVGTEMTPTLAAASFGSSVGAAGGPLGAAIGGGGMAALFVGAESYADAYNDARLTGSDHEQAQDHAAKSSKTAAAFAVAMGPLGKFGAKDALGKYVAKQAVSQTALGEAGNVAQNIVAREIDPDRDLTEGWLEAGVTSGTIGTVSSLAGRYSPIRKVTREDVGVKSKGAKKGPEGGIIPPPAPGGPEGTSVSPETIRSKGLPKPNEPVAEGQIIPLPEEAVAPFKPPAEPPLPKGKERFADTSKIVKINDKPHAYNEVTDSWEPVKGKTSPGQEPPQKGIQKSEPQGKELAKIEAPKPKEIIPAKVEKVVKGEEITPDVKRTSEKVFSRGDKDTAPEKSLYKKTSEWLNNNLSLRGIERNVFEWQTPLKVEGAKSMGKSPFKVKERENVPYRTAQATLRLPGMLEAAHKYGTPYFNKKEKRMDLKPNSKGLQEIWKDTLVNDEIKEAFQLNRMARRIQSQDLIEQGRELNLTPEEVSMALALEKKYPQLKKINQDLDNYIRSALNYGRDTGLITDDLYSYLEPLIQYTPFYRNTGTRGEWTDPKSSIVGQKANIHGLTGGSKNFLVRDPSGKPRLRTTSIREARRRAKELGKGSQVEDVGPATKDIHENVINNINHMIISGTRNVAAKENIKAALRTGVAEPVKTSRVAERRADGENIVSYREKGKEKFFKVNDPIYYMALNDSISNPDKNPNIVKTFFKAHKTLDSFVKLADPAVQLGITVKDFQRMLMIGKDKLGWSGVFKGIPSNYAAAFKAAFGGEVDPRIPKIMAGGGDTSFYKSRNAQEVYKLMQKDAKKNNGYVIVPADAEGGIKGLFGNVKDNFYKTIGFLEKGHKLSVYDAVKKSGGSDAEAIFEAADFMDYNKQGGAGWVKLLGDVISFLKTTLQGVHKFARELGHNYGWNRTTKTIGTVVGMSVLNALLNLIPDDSDETRENGYDKISEDQKNAYAHIDLYKILGQGSSSLGKKRADIMGLPRWVKIPKGWAEAALAQTVPERIVASFAEENDAKAELGQLGKVVLNNLYMNPMPPSAKTLIEQITNYDFYKQGPIVPFAQQNLEPELQFGPYTSGASKKLGETTEFLSPTRLDHLLKSLTGNIGTYIAQLPDVFDGNPTTEKEWSETQFFKRFIGSDIVRNNKVKNEMYKMAHDAAVTVNSLKKYEEMGEDEKAEKYDEKKGSLLDLNDYLNNPKSGVKAMIKNIDDDMAEIRKDKSLSGKEKKAQLDELYIEQNSLLQEFQDVTREIKREQKEEKARKRKE